MPTRNARPFLRQPGTWIFAGALLAVASFTGCDKSTTPPPAGNLPVITAHPAHKTNIVGGSATFTVTATGSDLSYQWIKGTSDTLTGETSATLVLPALVPGDNGAAFKVVVKNGAGAVVSNAGTLRVLYGDSLFVSRTMLVDTGAPLYEGSCTGCHGTDGRGSPGSTPPHTNSDWFMNNKRKTIQILLNGYGDSLFVNGMPYHGEMPSYNWMTNREIASILTYLRVVRNDSTVTSCVTYDANDTTTYDPATGFPYCTLIPRSQAERFADTVAVWEVELVRDSLTRLYPIQ